MADPVPAPRPEGEALATSPEVEAELARRKQFEPDIAAYGRTNGDPITLSEQIGHTESVYQDGYDAGRLAQDAASRAAERTRLAGEADGCAAQLRDAAYYQRQMGGHTLAKVLEESALTLVALGIDFAALRAQLAEAEKALAAFDDFLADAFNMGIDAGHPLDNGHSRREYEKERDELRAAHAAALARLATLEGR